MIGVIIGILLGASITFAYFTNFVRYEAGKGFVVIRRSKVLRFKNTTPKTRNGGPMEFTVKLDANDPLCKTIAYKEFEKSFIKLKEQANLLYL